MLKEITPGLILKGVSIVGKIFFLIVVVPKMPDGELANYLFLITVSLLMARLIGFGVEDALPLLVRGNRGTAGQSLGPYVVLLVIGVACFSAAFLADLDVLYVPFLVSILAAQFWLSGAVRSVSPLAFEVLTNIGWFIFPLLSLLQSQKLALTLVATMGCSLAINHVLVLFVARLNISAASFSLRQLISLMLSVRDSWKVCISNFVDLANMRSLVLWPKLFGAGANLDGIALALAYGEVLWQFFMVVVQRRYAKYCSTLTDPALVLRDSRMIGFSIIGIALAIAVSLWIVAPHIQEFIKFEWDLFAGISLIFGMSSAYFLVRYSLWALKGFSLSLLRNELVLLLLIPIAVVVLPQVAWVWVVACLFAVLYLAALIESRKIGLSPSEHPMKSVTSSEE